MVKLSKSVILIISTMCFSFAALGAEAKSEKHAKGVIKNRQAIFSLVKSNVGILGAMNKGKVPYNAETLKLNGMRIEQLATMAPDYFKVDTSKFDLETEAKSEIWTDMDGFMQKGDALIQAAKGLQTAAASGDEGQYKKAIGSLFKSCKSCHNDYKKD